MYIHILHIHVHPVCDHEHCLCFFLHKALLISDFECSYKYWNSSVKLISSMPDHARRGELRTRVILVKLIRPIDCVYCRLWTGIRIVLLRSLWSLIKGNNFFFHNSRFFLFKNVFYYTNSHRNSVNLLILIFLISVIRKNVC